MNIWKKSRRLGLIEEFYGGFYDTDNIVGRNFHKNVESNSSDFVLHVINKKRKN